MFLNTNWILDNLKQGKFLDGSDDSAMHNSMFRIQHQIFLLLFKDWVKHGEDIMKVWKQPKQWFSRLHKQSSFKKYLYLFKSMLVQSMDAPTTL